MRNNLLKNKNRFNLKCLISLVMLSAFTLTGCKTSESKVEGTWSMGGSNKPIRQVQIDIELQSLVAIQAFENKINEYWRVYDNYYQLDALTSPFQPHYWGQAVINISNFELKSLYNYLGVHKKGNFLGVDKDKWREITGEELTEAHIARIAESRKKFQSFAQKSIREFNQFFEISRLTLGSAVNIATTLATGPSPTIIGNSQAVEVTKNVVRSIFVGIPEFIYDNACKGKVCKSEDLMAYRYVLSEISGFFQDNVVSPAQFAVIRFFGYYFPTFSVHALEILHPGNLFKHITTFFENLVPGASESVRYGDKNRDDLTAVLKNYIESYLGQGDFFKVELGDDHIIKIIPELQKISELKQRLRDTKFADEKKIFKNILSLMEASLEESFIKDEPSTYKGDVNKDITSKIDNTGNEVFKNAVEQKIKIADLLINKVKENKIDINAPFITFNVGKWMTRTQGGSNDSKEEFYKSVFIEIDSDYYKYHKIIWDIFAVIDKANGVPREKFEKMPNRSDFERALVEKLEAVVDVAIKSLDE